MTLVFLCLALCLGGLRAEAEGVASKGRAPSTDARLNGAGTLYPFAGGWISVGGSTLRQLRPGAKKWDTLHTQPGDNLYRVGLDRERVLAAWENDPFIHVFNPGARTHVQLPKPTSERRMFQVDRLEVSTSGRDALVFMAGIPGDPIELWRIALDGASPPELLTQVAKGFLLHASHAGGVYVLAKGKNQQCGPGDCLPIGAIVAYELGDSGLTTKTLLSSDQLEFRGAKAVQGSDERTLVALIELNRGGRGVLRWDRGSEPVFHALPVKPLTSQPTGRALVNLQTNELVEPMTQGIALEVHRQPLDGAGPESVVTLPSPTTWKSPLFGWGTRANGSLWIHWGDQLVLLEANKPAIAYGLESVRGAQNEWAGADRYLEAPEALWVGIEMASGGRDFARVSLVDAAKRAVPWAAAPADSGCGKLPPLPVLMQWPAHGMPACSGGMPKPGAPPLRRPPVVLELPDGSKIIHDATNGCRRVTFDPCRSK